MSLITDLTKLSNQFKVESTSNFEKYKFHDYMAGTAGDIIQEETGKRPSLTCKDPEVLNHHGWKFYEGHKKLANHYKTSSKPDKKAEQKLIPNSK